MAALLSWRLIFHYLNDFFGVFEERQQEEQFGEQFNKVCTDLGMSVNNKKKQMSCIVDFLMLEFDTLQMEARLPKNKLKKTIEGVVKVLEKKNSTTHEELQFLLGLLFFMAKVACPGQSFLRHPYNALAKGGKYLHWSKPIEDDLF